MTDFTTNLALLPRVGDRVIVRTTGGSDLLPSKVSSVLEGGFLFRTEAGHGITEHGVREGCSWATLPPLPDQELCFTFTGEELEALRNEFRRARGGGWSEPFVAACDKLYDAFQHSG